MKKRKSAGGTIYKGETLHLLVNINELSVLQAIVSLMRRRVNRELLKEVRKYAKSSKKLSS